MNKWARALYQPNLPLKEGTYVTAGKDHISLSRKAASEGMVLLKNENVLPLAPGSRIACFGKGMWDMVKGGGGSGDVHAPYLTTLAEGLPAAGAVPFEPLLSYYEEDVKRQYSQGAAPGMTVEPAVPEELLKEASAWTDTALIAISRFSGEGWERQGGEFEDPETHPWKDEVSMPVRAARIYPDGDFYLTKQEKEMLACVCSHFAKVVAVLNTGGVIDTSWIRDNDRISGCLLMWQAGMEGGSAAADILFGKVNPSGRLPDTFAAALEDYPSTKDFHVSPWYVDYSEDIYVGYRYFETLPGAAQKVVYPFGFGLSYTVFETAFLGAEEQEDTVRFDLEVTNKGQKAGKEVTAIYFKAPQGKLGKPARALGAFAKTGLLEPGQSEKLTLTIAKTQMASFDDLGRIALYANVLEAGSYHFFLGANVREAVEIPFTFRVQEDTVTQQLSGLLRPNALKQRLRSDGAYEELPIGLVPDLNACAFEKMTPGSEEGLFPEQPGRERYMRMNPFKEGVRPLLDAAEGRMSLDDFMEQLDDPDLIHLLGGTPNTGVANTCGFGGLPEYGIPAVMTADGPAGVRIDPECGVYTTAWPCATLLASTWDTSLMAEVGRAAGEEVKENNLQIWLAPAMNIHRNPMCGRNFEYFSEDPLLTGKMAAAEVKGIQSNGISACIKHFAANNKETNRKHSDSRVSLRALREIYLKGFEIAVKEADPWTLMSSYNAINGQRASESRDLLEGILREEWGFTGAVTTDWWTRGEHYKEILAGNDVKMACGFPERVRKAMELGELTREDLKHCAKHVLELICRLD